MSDYAHSSQSLESARNIILHKVVRQQALMQRYDLKMDVNEKDILSARNSDELFLAEARVAARYWKRINVPISEHVEFSGRRPRSSDPVNRLLDIGYHHVTGRVKRLLQSRDMHGAIGVLHRARSSKASPLAYDLVELFRADTVDAELLRFFRLKKKPVTQLVKTDIALFLSRLNHRMRKSYYLKTFHACRSYEYYMELQILGFSKAVREKHVFQPIILPNRHESRC